MSKKIGESAGKLPQGDHTEYSLARMASDMDRKLSNPPPKKERNNPKPTTKELKQMEEDAKVQKERAENKGSIQVRYNYDTEKNEQSKDEGKTWTPVKMYHEEVDALMRKLSEIGVSGEKEGGKRRRKSRKRKRKTRRKRRTRRKSRRKRRRRKRRKTRR